MQDTKRNHAPGVDQVPVPGCACRACNVARCTPFERRYGIELVPVPALAIRRIDAGDGPWDRIEFACGCNLLWWSKRGDVCRVQYCRACVLASPIVPALVISQFVLGGIYDVLHISALDLARDRGRDRVFEARHALDRSCPHASLVYLIEPDGTLRFHAARIDSSD